MRNIIFSAILLLIVASCYDSSKPTEQENTIDSVYIGIIKGQILDNYTELPISNVIISTYPITSSTRTDDNGEFELLNVSQGIYDLNITHKDYFEFSTKIKVSDRLTNNVELFITSKESQNHTPNKPTLLFPSDNSSIGFNKITFRWECTDLDNDSLVYDIYYRELGSGFQRIGSNIATNAFDFEYGFNDIDQYQWYIVAKDNYALSISDTFSFKFKEIIIAELPNLIGYWKFDGDATDYGPNNYKGSIQNVLFINDRLNNDRRAASFTGKAGVNSKIVLPATIQLSDKFTISLWVKPSSLLGENGNIGYYDCVSKWGISGVNSASWAFGITKNSNLFLGTFRLNSTMRLATNKQIESEIWQHIAVTFNNGIAIFYVNGKQIEIASGMNIPQESNYNVSIGGRQDQLSSYNGAIDDLFIFDRVLTDQEIIQLSNLE